MATLKPNANKVYIGDRAEVGGRKGTVMFVGPAEFAGGGVVVGLRLDEKRATSECDGKYDGERLFRCKPGFGIFVPGGGRQEGGGREGRGRLGIKRR
jgi:dynactin complex subunit